MVVFQFLGVDKFTCLILIFTWPGKVRNRFDGMTRLGQAIKLLQALLPQKFHNAH